MATQTSPQFVMDLTEPNATLFLNRKDYRGYAVVNYGNEVAASFTRERVLQLKRMANCHPPLPNHHLTFTKLSKSVSQLLVDSEFPKSLDQSDKDPIKLFFKSLSLLAVRAFEDGLKVDMNLDNIYCCTIENIFILTKCIPLTPDDSVEFLVWKNEMKLLYEDIKKTLGIAKMFDEYVMFTELLDKSKSKEEFRSILQGWIFSDTDKRMSVIYKLTGMINHRGLKFLDYCGGAHNILVWRQKMSQDKSLQSLVDGFTQNKFDRPESSGYKRQEVYLFLTFLRTCLGHFRTFQNTFRSEALMVRYLDQEFLEIMAEVYLGCIAMEQDGLFDFGIEAK